MNLKNIFKIGAVVMLINGLLALFAIDMFMEAASFEMSPSLLTLGQFVGVTFLVMARHSLHGKLLIWPMMPCLLLAKYMP